MNCDKEYRYEVRDIVIVKVDTATGEEVLNRDGSIKHFRPKNTSDYLDVISYNIIEYDDNEVEEA
jgi:hypothetical protein